MQDELTAAIASDLGITDLPIAEQQELIGQFGEVALKAATLAVVGKLAPEMRDEFARLAGGGDAAALTAFLNKEVPAHEQLAKDAVAEEIKRFKAFQGA
ncbi:MAG: hypothetical protein RLZZ26_28 [Candidatus Parcubacteria bacterium]|jgi:hypothetical protein